MLDIVNSSLSQIQGLYDWLNLAMLNWISNKYSSCRELEGWSSLIYMNSDCPRDSLYTIRITEGNEVFLWPFFLTFIPFLLLGLVGGYWIIYQYIKKPLNEPNAHLKIYMEESLV